MTLMKWDPFRDLRGIERRLNETFNGLSGAAGLEESYGHWAPAVDIFERGDELVIRAELPGINREEIEVSVENDTLTLRGERKRDVEVEEGKSHRSERTYGTFTRRFVLPTTVDAGRIAATYRDGVLDLVLPKSEKSKPRRVEIQAA